MASSSPIQRFVTGLESVEIRQVVELDGQGVGRVDQYVEAGENVVFRLSASGASTRRRGAWTSRSTTRTSRPLG